MGTRLGPYEPNETWTGSRGTFSQRKCLTSPSASHASGPSRQPRLQPSQPTISGTVTPLA